MNNRFKYRIWDHSTKNMISEDNNLYFISTDGSIYINDIVSDRCVYSGNRNNNFVVQFYIGLTDKIGKEIYEGDILRANKQNETLIGFVQYDVLYGAYRLIVSDILSFTFYQLTNLEVIGNKFENPDLLK
jgi:uncharacterized phage protein (TIGR01671 family)